MTPSDVKATLSFSDGSPSMELPIYKGTIGPEVIDIRKLYGQTGKFTYDPGFLSTASCNSTRADMPIARARCKSAAIVAVSRISAMSSMASAPASRASTT